MIRRAAIAAFLLSGCAAPRNDYSVAINQEFSSDEIVAIYDGLATWPAAAPELQLVVSVGTNAEVMFHRGTLGLKDECGHTWYNPIDGTSNITIDAEKLAAVGQTARLGTLAAHEMGHALELRHTRGEPNLMNPTIEQMAPGPTPADVAALRAR